MSALYLTLLAVLLAGPGARDLVTVAGVSLRHGQRPGVLFTAVLVSIATVAFAAWAASFVAPLLAPPARAFLAGLALLLAGAESLVLGKRRLPTEPTHSLPALAVVLTAHQATDAARFIVFGIGAGMNAPLPAAVGGALAGMVLVGAAWMFPSQSIARRVLLSRRVLGAALLLAGGFVCLRAVGKL